MTAETHEDGEKNLKIVYKKVGYFAKELEPYEFYEKKWNHESQWKKTAVMNKRIDSEVDVVYTELDIARIQKEKNMLKMAKTARKAIKRENMVIDKFLQDVESMVTLLKPVLDKMQELFDSLRNKVPEIQLDIATTEC